MENGKIHDIFSETDSVMSNSKKESQPSLKEIKPAENLLSISKNPIPLIPKLDFEKSLRKEIPSDKLISIKQSENVEDDE